MAESRVPAQRVQSRHGGADRGLYQATRRQTAGEIRVSQTAVHLSPTPAPLELYVAGFCSTLEQPALLTALTQHPASHTPCFCSGTFQNSPASISCLLSLFQLSGLSVPKSSFPKMLGLFLPEPCGMDKTWPHLSPAAEKSPP